jgi:pimeloyl-ACP methyl ester carboxylesterase
MKVSPALLDASLNAPFKAIDMVNMFSHSTLAPPPSCYGPGTWLYGGSRALMRRVLASNSKVNLFHHGFSMCDGYEGAVGAAEKWAQAKKPTAIICGAADQMTPAKAALGIAQAIAHAQRVNVAGGHAMMTESPEATLQALQALLKQ